MYKTVSEPYGKWLERFGSPFSIQQSADRMSDEGVTDPWMGQYAVCVQCQYLTKGCLILLITVHRFRNSFVHGLMQEDNCSEGEAPYLSDIGAELLLHVLPLPCVCCVVVEQSVKNKCVKNGPGKSRSATVFVEHIVDCSMHLM